MTARKQFIITFIIIQIIASALMAIAAGYFLSTSLDQIITSSDNPILSIMHDRVMMRTIISFIGIALIVAVISLPAGIFLSRLMVGPYLRTMQRFSTLARNRLSSEDLTGIDSGERRILEQYASVLHEDMKIIGDYEKARSWKEGARMLMHELKNPLTPLKLSAEQIVYAGNTVSETDISTILVSLQDIENILSMFRNLVNIEFGTKEIVSIPAAIDELLCQLRACGLQFESINETSGVTFRSFFEPALVKMVLINLINNSIEENPKGCAIHTFITDQILTLEVLTRDRTIAEPSLVFKAGYSKKGANRGFGLFLAKLISDYLDLNISCANTPSGAIFSIHFNEIVSSAQPEVPS
jgi:signal transduction histidine kinase